ncbi:hypothetical protein Tco_1059324 [Tanacetum coccineum]
MTTLADKAILSGADNRPPMLEKDMYDSWKIKWNYNMLNRQNRRMILESVESGPLIWPSIVENGVTRPKKYSELSATKALQADFFTYGFTLSPQQTQLINHHTSFTHYPSNDYQFIIHHNIYSPSSSIPKLEYPPLVDQQSEFSQQESGLIVPVFQKGYDLIDTINYMMSFLTAAVTSRYPTTNNQLRNSSNPRQQATINNGRVTLQPIQGRQTFVAAGISRTYTPGASGNNSGKQRKRLAFLADPGIPEGQATQTVITHNAAYQANDLDAYDFDCDELNTAKVALMANLSHYGSNRILSDVHKHDNVNNNILIKFVQLCRRLNSQIVCEHYRD